MRNRLELAQHFADLGFRRGAEIGVYKGAFSKFMLDTIPNLNLLSVDPYHRRRVHAHVYRETVAVLRDYPGSTLLRGFSWETAELIPDEWLDFVYIDGNHTYNHIKGDLEHWAPKVRPGGIVSGHDYFDFEDCAVRTAVDEYAALHQIELRKTGEQDQPSWWFVKGRIWLG